MLRFVPDGLLEGLMRPFYMADPVAGLYLEEAAPDWRFAALLGLLAFAVLRRRGLPALDRRQGLAVGGTLLLLVVWTFVIGNGRYFMWALLFVGPLMVLACATLPVSRSMRVALLGVLLVLQGSSVMLAREANPWALVRVRQQAMPLPDSPLRRSPAVFLTISNLSYAALVPLFHPDSRWANVAGQLDLRPGRPEWPHLQALLDSPLPQYLVTAVRPEDRDPQGQPFGIPLQALQTLMAPLDRHLVPGGCETLWSRLSGPGAIETAETEGRRGFWICRLERGAARTDGEPVDPGYGPAEQAALDEVERRCPRFFPPGGGRVSPVPGVLLRHYAWSDVRLWTVRDGWVMFQYYRAANPTVLGRVPDVSAGRFTLPCDKLPGRYRPFWQRD